MYIANMQLRGGLTGEVPTAAEQASDSQAWQWLSEFNYALFQRLVTLEAQGPINLSRRQDINHIYMAVAYTAEYPELIGEGTIAFGHLDKCLVASAEVPAVMAGKPVDQVSDAEVITRWMTRAVCRDASGEVCHDRLQRRTPTEHDWRGIAGYLTRFDKKLRRVEQAGRR